MKITVTSIKKSLKKDYGWLNLDSTSQKDLIDQIIKDTLTIVDKKLRYHKGISIKK